MHGRGRAWQGTHVAVGGGCGGGGHVWQVTGGQAWQGGGMCGRGRARQILRDTVNERVVRILLECILVFMQFSVIFG